MGKRQFKIKFRQYDGGEHIFYPNYYKCANTVSYGDLVAWMWGGILKFGCVATVKGENVMVTLLTRKQTAGVRTAFHKDRLICIFQPES